MTKDGYISVQRTFIKSTKDHDTGNITDINIYLVKENSIKENEVLILTYSNNLEDNFKLEVLNDESIEVKTINHQTKYGILSTEIKRHNEKFDTELSEIIRLVLKINQNNLKKCYNITYNNTINGLEKYSCEVCIYTSSNMFLLHSPQYSREEYNYWDLGCLDIKHMLFYEIGLLTKGLYSDKNIYFTEWIILLQLIIDNKLYTKLFESFNFNKGLLYLNDRLLYEPAFIRSIKSIANDQLSVDFMIFLCDIMKNNQQMVSFSIFKKKITSNLKNFSQINN